jgi:hypothetical protein
VPPVKVNCFRIIFKPKTCKQKKKEEEERTLKICVFNVSSEKKLNLNDHSHLNCLELQGFGKEKYDLFTPQITEKVYGKVVLF